MASSALRPIAPFTKYSKKNNAIPFNFGISEDLSILDNTPAKKNRNLEQQRLKNQF